jgi:CBS domain-containing protein
MPSMPSSLPISTEKAPNVILDVIVRLKVKDALFHDVVKTEKNSTFRDVQKLMKENHISGVPIVDKEKVIGMISVNDIMNALDRGYIEDKIENYMAPSLVVLEEDMPLAFAINNFDKFPYRRYPVINKEKKLVGMITSRDILVALLHELDKEIKELESRIQKEHVEYPNQIYKEYILNKFDLENAGRSSFEIKKILKNRNLSQNIIRRASVASYELEINVVIHSEGGKIVFIVDEKQITIIAKDKGPGIADVSLVLQEGYSTANEWIRSLGFGAGMGIPNTKKVSDVFDIQSQLGKGTTVKSIIYLNEYPPGHKLTGGA